MLSVSIIYESCSEKKGYLLYKYASQPGYIFRQRAKLSGNDLGHCDFGVIYNSKWKHNQLSDFLYKNKVMLQHQTTQSLLSLSIQPHQGSDSPKEFCINQGFLPFIRKCTFIQLLCLQHTLYVQDSNTFLKSALNTFSFELTPKEFVDWSLVVVVFFQQQETNLPLPSLENLVSSPGISWQYPTPKLVICPCLAFEMNKGWLGAAIQLHNVIVFNSGGKNNK